MRQLETVQNRFQMVCQLAKRHGADIGPCRPGDPLGNAIRRSLQLFGEALLDAADIPLPNRLRVQAARGKGYLPKILWVALTPYNRKVSNDIAVVACFGQHGEGAVVGAMDSITFPRRLADRTKRTGKECIRVNVNGGRTTNNYNDKFMNPREFLSTDFAPEELIKHSEESIALLRKLRAEQ